MVLGEKFDFKKKKTHALITSRPPPQTFLLNRRPDRRHVTSCRDVLSPSCGLLHASAGASVPHSAPLATLRSCFARMDEAVAFPAVSESDETNTGACPQSTVPQRKVKLDCRLEVSKFAITRRPSGSEKKQQERWLSINGT